MKNALSLTLLHVRVISLRTIWIFLKVETKYRTNQSWWPKNENVFIIEGLKVELKMGKYHPIMSRETYNHE